MSSLIAQMVGRNEANRSLVPVLEHLKGIVDHIVFTDDASTDETPEIASGYGAMVYRNDEQMFTKNEFALRQGAWHNLENHAVVGDWILAIDCDEFLYNYSPHLSLDDLMRQNKWDILGIEFYHMWSPTAYRVDKAFAPVTSSRLFRYQEGGRFRQRDLACGAEPTYIQDFMRAGRFLPNTGLRMKHVGYAQPEDKQMKFDRYMALDGGKFHAKTHLESIIDPEPTLVEWIDPPDGCIMRDRDA